MCPVFEQVEVGPGFLRYERFLHESWPYLRCALSGTIAPVESYLCRNLSVNCSVYRGTLSARFAASWISEPYRCPEMCWTSHLKFGPLCLSCLYSRQTFCGKTAQLS